MPHEVLRPTISIAPRLGSTLADDRNWLYRLLIKLISNKALRELSAAHPEAEESLHTFRQWAEKGRFEHFSALRATSRSVDKNRLIAAIAFAPQLLWVKAALTHAESSTGDWK